MPTAAVVAIVIPDKRIHEMPVHWVDDPDSRVDILATALEDLRGVARLSRDAGRRDLRHSGPVTARPTTNRGI